MVGDLPKGAPGRGDLEVARRGVMKLDRVTVAVCKQPLADSRLTLYGYKTVATVPLEAEMPAFWPEGKPKHRRHSLVMIPRSRPPSPNTLDKEPVSCTTIEEFKEAGRQAYLEMYKNYRPPAEAPRKINVVRFLMLFPGKAFKYLTNLLLGSPEQNWRLPR